MTTLAAQPVSIQQTQGGMYKQLETMGTHKQIEAAKNVYVYLNGDRHFVGRKFVVNRKHIGNFDGFLNQVTVGIKAPFGAVRKIYTPNAGTRVEQLDQLINGMDLVAGGGEKFKKLGYKEISIKRRQPQKPSGNKVTRTGDTDFGTDDFFDYEQFRNSHRMNVEARWRKYVKEPCQIFVYGNGDPLTGATKLLIIPRMMKSWDLVLREVTEKISLRTGQAVRKLYDMNYKLLNEPTQLENGRFYIAVGTEKIKKANYGETNKFTKSTQQHHSPRRPNQPLPPIRKARPKARQQPADGEKTGTSYTKMYAKKKKLTVMGASAATGGRPLVIEESSKPATESVFHAKPVKVKRSAKPADSVPPPADPSTSVFLSNATQEVAEEVVEDEDTKVDLPVDQIPAETVDEEIPAAAESPVPVVAASPEPAAPVEDVPAATQVVEEATVAESPQPAAVESPSPAATPAPEKVLLQPKPSQSLPRTRSKTAKRQSRAQKKVKSRVES